MSYVHICTLDISLARLVHTIITDCNSFMCNLGVNLKGELLLCGISATKRCILYVYVRVCVYVATHDCTNNYKGLPTQNMMRV